MANNTIITTNPDTSIIGEIVDNKCSITCNNGGNYEIIATQNNIVKSKNINIKDLGIPENPQDCDYYFDSDSDFIDRINSIVTTHNYDLSELTFGFGGTWSGNGSSFPAYNDWTKIIKSPKALVFDLDLGQSYQLHSMFEGCSELESVSPYLFINVPKEPSVFNIPVILNSLFEGCIKLKSIPKELFNPISELNTQYAINTFKNSGIEDASKLLSNFKNLKDAKYTFASCPNLVNVTNVISSYNINLRNVFCMFLNCTSITSNIPEIWDPAQFPNINTSTQSYYGSYAKGCVNAANYDEIPEKFK